MGASTAFTRAGASKGSAVKRRSPTIFIEYAHVSNKKKWMYKQGTLSKIRRIGWNCSILFQQISSY